MVIGPAQAESSIPQPAFLLLLTPKSPSHLVPSETPALPSTFHVWFSWINLSLCGLENQAYVWASAVGKVVVVGGWKHTARSGSQ